ncbi:hypothetical protein HKBW3S25_01752, partial [Candidatus Hakubella thermalkaliphila]
LKSLNPIGHFCAAQLPHQDVLDLPPTLPALFPQQPQTHPVLSGEYRQSLPESSRRKWCCRRKGVLHYGGRSEDFPKSSWSSPIFVSETVLEAASIVIQSLEEEVQKFRDFLNSVEPEAVNK